MERQLDDAADAAAGNSGLAAEFNAAVQHQTAAVMDDMMDNLRWWYAGEAGGLTLLPVFALVLHSNTGTLLHYFPSWHTATLGYTAILLPVSSTLLHRYTGTLSSSCNGNLSEAWRRGPGRCREDTVARAEVAGDAALPSAAQGARRGDQVLALLALEIDVGRDLIFDYSWFPGAFHWGQPAQLEHL